jgi:predicted 2-oxoglutarate/Fe(II)-dependent dioxygenase YbiX
MVGNPDDPPSQTPHRDHAGGRVPATTTLYYLQVDDTVGGELVIYDDVDGPSHRVTPTTDLLVVIPGEQLHAVDPLVRGYRVTIVTNFYLTR